MRHPSWRRSIFRQAALVILLATAGAVWGWAGRSLADGNTDTPRDARWRADLSYLAATLPRKHKNLFFRLPRAEFHARLAVLARQVSDLSDVQLYVELARVCAAVGEAHTAITPTLRFRAVPVRFYWFADGLYPVAWAPHCRAIAHGRLVGIGETPLEEVIARLSQLVPQDNMASLKVRLPGLLHNYDLLVASGVIPDAGLVRYWVEDESGARRAVDVAVEPSAGQRLERALPPEVHLPLYLSRDDWFWYELIANGKVLYVQYNRCWDRALQKKANPHDPRLAEYPDFAEFTAAVFTALQANPVELVVVDLRQNGGGASQLGTAFIKKLAAHPKVKAGVQVAGIIGRQTFSSGLLNALDLKRIARARLYGEPTSGKPNHYGEVERFALPNSQWQVSYSTKYFRNVPGDPDSLYPDVTVELAYHDYRAGRDPVLEAVLDSR